MSFRELWLGTAACLLAIGCRQEPAAPQADAATIEAPAPAPEAAASSAGSAQPAGCAPLRERYTKAREAGGACAADSDCVCFRYGLDVYAGVTDSATKAELERIHSAFSDAGCAALVWEGPPIQCAPKCRAKRCTARR